MSTSLEASGKALTTHVYRGVVVAITPIENSGIRTGTRFTFRVGEFKRQAFTMAAAMQIIDGLLASEQLASEQLASEQLASEQLASEQLAHTRYMSAMRGDDSSLV